jgi:hypothetical protein
VGNAGLGRGHSFGNCCDDSIDREKMARSFVDKLFALEGKTAMLLG